MHRNHSIDIAKFIALFLMVLCHIPNTFISFWVCSFHMPLFFFVSGLCYNPDRFGWKKGFRTLLVPYLIFNLFVILLNAIINVMSSHGGNMQDMLSNYFFGMFCGSSSINAPFPMPIGPSWFLLAFFVVKISARYILRCNKWVQAVCVLIPFLIVVLLGKKISWYLWSVNCAALSSVFFYIAYYLKSQINSFLNSRRLIYFIPLLAIISCLAYYNQTVNIWNGSYGKNPVMFVLLGVDGTLLVLSICKYIHFIPDAILFTYRVGAIFILCMNMWILEYLMLAYRRFCVHDVPFDGLDRIGLTCVVFAISWPCIRFLYRHAPWTMGQIKKQ